MTDFIETLRAEVILGRECDGFFNTDPGRYIKERHNETITDAIEKFKSANPCDEKEILKIQIEIKAADNALIWLNEMVIAGRNAYQQLEILSNNEET